MRTIALFGATGHTGRRVQAALTGRGDAVQALSRDASKLAAQPGVTVTVGDARDRLCVAKVVDGSDAVICCLGMHDISVAATDFSSSVACIVEVAKAADVRRVIAIASALVLPHAAGGLRGDHGVPAVLANVAAEHRRNYQTLASSGLDWTLMCPLDLKADIAPGRARLAFDDVPSGSAVTGYDDLAQAMVDLLDRPDSIGHRIGIVSVL